MKILITGASKGIGFATAKMLAADGHDIVGLARTAPEDFPGEFHCVDLMDEPARSKLLSEVTKEHNFDGLLNNVGLVNPAPLEEITLEQFDACIDVNLRVSLQTTQAVLPHMKSQKHGRIVFTSSMVVAGVPYRSSYAAAKAGMVSFTRAGHWNLPSTASPSILWHPGQSKLNFSTPTTHRAVKVANATLKVSQ